jgi:MYXO-CTERM domain-containing protein
MFKRRSRTKKTVDAAVETARTTNPAVPVAGAAGFALLGASLMRRRRSSRTG